MINNIHFILIFYIKVPHQKVLGHEHNNISNNCQDFSKWIFKKLSLKYIEANINNSIREEIPQTFFLLQKTID